MAIGVASTAAAIFAPDIRGWFVGLFVPTLQKISVGGEYDSLTSGRRYLFVQNDGHVVVFLILPGGEKILVGSGAVKDKDPDAVGDEVVEIILQVELTDGEQSARRTATLLLRPNEGGKILSGSFQGEHKEEKGDLFFVRRIAG